MPCENCTAPITVFLSAIAMQVVTTLEGAVCDSIRKTRPPLDTIADGYPGQIVLPPEY